MVKGGVGGWKGGEGEGLGGVVNGGVGGCTGGEGEGDGEGAWLRVELEGGRVEMERGRG